jgi:Txe/YoeB family toxin of toxin-antitoxin system
MSVGKGGGFLNWTVHYTKRAAKDAARIKASHLYSKAKYLLEVIRKNPFQTPPEYEKLRGNLSGAYARRINAQHRLVYEVDETVHAVKIVSMWSHYE